jgi:hypothetical protein
MTLIIVERQRRIFRGRLYDNSSKAIANSKSLSADARSWSMANYSFFVVT